MTSTALDVRLGTSEAAGRAHATTSTRGVSLVTARSGADEKRVPLLAILAVQSALLLAAIRLVGAHGWDDSAITLAYARTFAETGRIALTPASEHVEGFSSVAWFGLNALVAL